MFKAAGPIPGTHERVKRVALAVRDGPCMLAGK